MISLRHLFMIGDTAGHDDLSTARYTRFHEKHHAGKDVYDKERLQANLGQTKEWA